MQELELTNFVLRGTKIIVVDGKARKLIEALTGTVDTKVDNVVFVSTVDELREAINGKQDTITGVSVEELRSLNGITGNVQTQLNGKQNTITGITEDELNSLSGITGNVQTQLNGKQNTITGVTESELRQLSGVSGNVQTQLNGKQNTITGVTESELQKLSGVTSNVQTQINNLNDALSSKADSSTVSDISTKLGGHTVGTNVPSNAKFTDTTYSNGTGLNLSGTQFSVKYGSAAGTACQGNDSRLSDARTPKSHTHDDRYIVSTDYSGYTRVTTMRLVANTDTMLVWMADGKTRAFNAPVWSDSRLKNNIKDSDINALDLINSIKMREFDFNDESYGTHKDIGYVAQELIDVIPEAVITVPQDEEKTGYKELCQINENAIIKYLVKAVQELSDKVKELEKLM